MQIPPEIIDKIKQAVDIVDIIGSYITLKKKGANYWGPCPFHSEKTASFSVSPAKQIFKCYCIRSKKNGKIGNRFINTF